MGFIGFSVSGETPLQAIYASICLYGMGQRDLPPNLLVEIARWVAPLCTVSVLLVVAKSIAYRLRAAIALLSGKSVAIYGPTAEKKAMLRKLGGRGIDVGEHPLRANSYILLGSEEENLTYYNNYLTNTSAQVFAKCSSLPTVVGYDNLRLFYPEEMAARIFWQKHSPYEISKAKGHKISIAMVGFGTLGREVLLSALQNNVFSLDQRISYDIFGDSEGFTKIHYRLSEISDPVTFHDEPWYDHIDLLASADMIILAEQKDQIALAVSMTLALPAKRIHVLSAIPTATNLMAGEPKLHDLAVFDWKAISSDPFYIIEEETYYYAKRINLRYANLFRQPSDILEENDENADAVWRELDSFSRLSNVRAADFKHIVDRIIGTHESYTPEQIEASHPEAFEQIAELEHMRWARYHFLNNWRQGEPVNGESKNKNVTMRVHRLLVPYSKLDEKDREMDRRNIRILLDVFNTKRKK